MIQTSCDCSLLAFWFYHVVCLPVFITCSLVIGQGSLQRFPHFLIHILTLNFLSQHHCGDVGNNTTWRNERFSVCWWSKSITIQKICYAASTDKPLPKLRTANCEIADIWFLSPRITCRCCLWLFPVSWFNCANIWYLMQPIQHGSTESMEMVLKRKEKNPFPSGIFYWDYHAEFLLLWRNL